MHKWGIVTKIAVSASGVVLVFLLLGGFVLIDFEIRLVRSFQDEHVAKVNQSIDERKRAEEDSLKKNVAFNTRILGEISARHLYNIDPESMEQPLRSYMNYPEIQAIHVFDDSGEPFAAAWKIREDINLGETLPDDLTLDSNLSAQVDAIYGQQKIGHVTVHYTDALLVENIQHAKENASKEAETFHNSSRSRLQRAIINQSIGAMFIIVALVGCLMILLRILVLKHLNTVSHVAHKLTDFDLTVSVNTNKNDEIGNLFTAINTMVRSFKNVLSQVQRSGIQVTSSATELSATAKQQEATMASQMESTHRVVKAVQEISDLAVDLADTMKQVASMLQETAGFATSGQTDLTHMQTAMHQMENASVSISSRLQAINEKADNITAVVTTITKVADQTNLLSLNAAIEAEKAGEYGRGFTVVAREIRRLADQTAVATLDIGQMVREMQSAVSAGVMEMDKFIAEVRHSAEDVERISKHLTRIIEQVQALSPNFEEVNVAMEQQSKNAQSINTAMLNLSEEMQQTKESLHETYFAIEQLNEASRGLQNQVSRFKVSEV